MNDGLVSIREDRPLPTTFVELPPAPPEFRREELVRLRNRLNMTQATMAAFVNVSKKTLESWEQGVRSPNGAALRLLQVMDRPAILSTAMAGSPQRATKARQTSRKRTTRANQS